MNLKKLNFFVDVFSLVLSFDFHTWVIYKARKVKFKFEAFMQVLFCRDGMTLMTKSNNILKEITLYKVEFGSLLCDIS